MGLVDFLSEYDFHERHSISVNRTSKDAYAATKALLPKEISPLVFLMLAVRKLPDSLLGRQQQHHEKSRPFLSMLLDNGFTLFEDSDQEIVFGAIGQFWKPSGGDIVGLNDPKEFLEFNRPDYAKVVANLSFQPKGEKTVVSTETRIRLPDEKTRKKFAIYWRIISCGSGLIRIMWLRAIKRKAEK